MSAKVSTKVSARSKDFAVRGARRRFHRLAKTGWLGGVLSLCLFMEVVSDPAYAQSMPGRTQWVTGTGAAAPATSPAGVRADDPAAPAALSLSPSLDSAATPPTVIVGGVTQGERGAAAQAGAVPARQRYVPHQEPDGLGRDTNRLLAMQANGDVTGPPLHMLGAEATPAFQRYMKSFTQTIPQFFDQKVKSSQGE